MPVSGSLQLSLELGICRNPGRHTRFRDSKTSGKLCFLGRNLPSSLKQCTWGSNLSNRMHRQDWALSCRYRQYRCHCFFNVGTSLDANCVKKATLNLARSSNPFQGVPHVIKLASSIGILTFAIWGLGPLMRLSRNILLQKRDNSWKKSSTYQVITSYIQALLLWTGAIIICRTLDPMILPTEVGQVVKQRLLNFIRSLSTVLAVAYFLSSVIQQAQKQFVEDNQYETRNMGFQFAGKAVYTAIWVAAFSLFMELLGFSTQRWLTAGGLGTVLLTLAGREIFKNFLSSIMIHATRPFVLKERIQIKIDGYDVSGTVENVGWWSPTILRGEGREAVYIPNHKFTVSVVRNLSQKTHWRIKTHLAISHLDVKKINRIVADLRKVLAKNPHVEQQKLHRRVFLDNINPENQALMILISCFVKTSRHEEYLCIKETILLDLLRVIGHHRARLATPIWTMQKTLTEAEFGNVPFSDTIYENGTTSNCPLLLIEPSKINRDDKAKRQARSPRATGDNDTKPSTKSAKDRVDAKGETIDPISTTTILSKNHKAKAVQTSDDNNPDSELKDILNPNIIAKSSSEPKPENGRKSSASKANTGTSSDPGKQSPSPKKQDVRQSVEQSSTSKPSLEENIVLGIALEGLKRALPTGEDTVAASDPESATMRGGNGLATSKRGENDVKTCKSSGSFNGS